MIAPVTEKVHHADPNGIQQIYRFDNDRGASVVRFFGSYGYERGLWEVAEIKFNSEDNDDWELQDDVIGFLTWKEVIELLNQIKDR